MSLERCAILMLLAKAGSDTVIYQHQTAEGLFLWAFVLALAFVWLVEKWLRGDKKEAERG